MLTPAVSLMGTHLGRVQLQVTRWRLYGVLDPLPMCARGFSSSWGLLHTPSAGTHKNIFLVWFEAYNMVSESAHPHDVSVPLPQSFVGSSKHWTALNLDPEGLS